MKRQHLSLIALPLAWMSVAGCYYDVESELYPELNCDTANTGFAARIEPIFADNCAVCHSGASPDGGLALESFGNIQPAALSGLIEDRISRPAGDALLMPPGGSLGACDIQSITQWIADGAPEN